MEANPSNNKDKKLSNSIEIERFFKNPTLSFIYKKSQKISCAIYLVTNHLSDNEPLKWSIRELVLGLIKDIFFLKDDFLKNSLILEDIKDHITEIISLLDLLVSTGFISKMNHQILKDEISNMVMFLGPDYDLTSPRESDISANFFDIGNFPPKISLEEIPDIDYRSDLGGFDRIIPKDENYSNKGHHKGQVSKGHLSFRDLSFNKVVKSLQKDKTKNSSSERKQLIINLIKSKKEVTIKDISKSIDGYSEKTLQRDVVSLVKAGVLKREGKKRWSKYLLA